MDGFISEKAITDCKSKNYTIYSNFRAGLNLYHDCLKKSAKWMLVWLKALDHWFGQFV